MRLAELILGVGPVVCDKQRRPEVATPVCDGNGGPTHVAEFAGKGYECPCLTACEWDVHAPDSIVKRLTLGGPQNRSLGIPSFAWKVGVEWPRDPTLLLKGEIRN